MTGLWAFKGGVSYRKKIAVPKCFVSSRETLAQAQGNGVLCMVIHFIKILHGIQYKNIMDIVIQYTVKHPQNKKNKQHSHRGGGPNSARI